MMKKAKQRADLSLIERGLALTQAEAQALIMAGQVHTHDRKIEKPGENISLDTVLTVKGKGHSWVGRGGIKLAHALAYFNINPSETITLDIGASTGGFTDVLLTKNAQRVYAVDAGYNQLAWKLRQDPRVVVMEKTNARLLTRVLIPEAPQLIVCDASFISLKQVLPAALDLAQPGATLIALIKPQFEVEKSLVSKGGIVTDPSVHKAIIKDIVSWVEHIAGWKVLGVTPSPITGADGNQEFLIAAQKSELQFATHY